MNPKTTQAERVIELFGSAPNLARLLGVNDSTVYRWTYPANAGGTDGIIPGRALRRILELAPRQNPPVIITAADLYPAA